jgi:hypothetical protein
MNNITTYPVLCIPRAMLFHTAEFVENAFNKAAQGKFVKSVAQTTTTDKAGAKFNVFFIHPDQDFKSNRNIDILYDTLKTQGTVNISTGTGTFFWKVKLYVPHMKAQYLPPPALVEQAPQIPVMVVRPIQISPRVMTVEEEAEFEEWKREKAAKIAAKTSDEMRHTFGERIYPRVVEFLAKEFPNFKHSGKITGMILEWPPNVIEHLIANPEEFERAVREGVQVFREHLLREAGAA